MCLYIYIYFTKLILCYYYLNIRPLFQKDFTYITSKKNIFVKKLVNIITKLLLINILSIKQPEISTLPLQ